jgi:polysaccharide biosynthesis/export protein
MKRRKIQEVRIITLIVFINILFSISTCFSQKDQIKKDYYQIGPNERLLITVHLFGEVRRPGEFLVADDTDILELISKAGGPTEFSNLGDIKITRGLIKTNIDEKSVKNNSKQVIKLNLKKLLNNEKYRQRIPILQPGDVVQVGRNNWFKWQTVFRVASEIALIVQAAYWYSLIKKD